MAKDFWNKYAGIDTLYDTPGKGYVLFQIDSEVTTLKLYRLLTRTPRIMTMDGIVWSQNDRPPMSVIIRGMGEFKRKGWPHANTKPK